MSKSEERGRGFHLTSFGVKNYARENIDSVELVGPFTQTSLMATRTVWSLCRGFARSLTRMKLFRGCNFSHVPEDLQRTSLNIDFSIPIRISYRSVTSQLEPVTIYRERSRSHVLDSLPSSFSVERCPSTTNTQLRADR